ncbi:hypothetical protein SNEBB_002932 [Seison nebaliae]|nr:hypothetical protein SNEBB_002932 [Seison nebaliae]
MGGNLSNQLMYNQNMLQQQQHMMMNFHSQRMAINRMAQDEMNMRQIALMMGNNLQQQQQQQIMMQQQPSHDVIMDHQHMIQQQLMHQHHHNHHLSPTSPPILPSAPPSLPPPSIPPPVPQQPMQQPAMIQPSPMMMQQPSHMMPQMMQQPPMAMPSPGQLSSDMIYQQVPALPSPALPPISPSLPASTSELSQSQFIIPNEEQMIQEEMMMSETCEHEPIQSAPIQYNEMPLQDDFVDPMEEYNLEDYVINSPETYKPSKFQKSPIYQDRKRLKNHSFQNYSRKYSPYWKRRSGSSMLISRPTASPVYPNKVRYEKPSYGIQSKYFSKKPDYSNKIKMSPTLSPMEKKVYKTFVKSTRDTISLTDLERISKKNMEIRKETKSEIPVEYTKNPLSLLPPIPSVERLYFRLATASKDTNPSSYPIQKCLLQLSPTGVLKKLINVFEKRMIKSLSKEMSGRYNSIPHSLPPHIKLCFPFEVQGENEFWASDLALIKILTNMVTKENANLDKTANGSKMVDSKSETIPKPQFTLFCDNEHHAIKLVISSPQFLDKVKEFANDFSEEIATANIEVIPFDNKNSSKNLSEDSFVRQMTLPDESITYPLVIYEAKSKRDYKLAKRAAIQTFKYFLVNGIHDQLIDIENSSKVSMSKYTANKRKKIENGSGWDMQLIYSPIKGFN